MDLQEVQTEITQNRNQLIISIMAERKRKEDFAEAERWSGKEHYGRIAKEESTKLFSPL